MPPAVRGHQRAAVRYKRAWPGLVCTQHRSTSWRKDGISAPSVPMEASVLRALLAVVLCSSGVVFCAAEHRHGARLGAAWAYRNVSANPSRYPLYMLQLYRSFRTADWSPGAGGGGDQPLQGSDSVLSLTAGGESAATTGY